MNKDLFLIILAVGVLVLAGLLFIAKSAPVVEVEIVSEPEVVIEEPKPAYTQQVIGTSVEGRPIEVYTFGNGDTELLFVGGMHGGYEWNGVALALEFIEYYKTDKDEIPDSLTVSIIPSLNPDAVYAITGVEGAFKAEDILVDADQAKARFNANDVDLNRNFDCKWQSTSTWRGKTVSAGLEAFSEPETASLRDYVVKKSPKAVVFWHSQANNVYASECENGVLPETLDVMQAYSDASGYGAVPSFDAYPITGDAEGWLASIGIPAVTVELKTHDVIEWSKNRAGVNALFDLYTTSQ